jgi:hypothetical protein
MARRISRTSASYSDASIVSPVPVASCSGSGNGEVARFSLLSARVFSVRVGSVIEPQAMPRRLGSRTSVDGPLSLHIDQLGDVLGTGMVSVIEAVVMVIGVLVSAALVLAVALLLISFWMAPR